MRRLATSLSLVNFLSRAILILHRLLCSDGEQPLCISFLMGFLNEAVAKETLQELGRPWSDCIPSSSVSLSSKSDGQETGEAGSRRQGLRSALASGVSGFQGQPRGIHGSYEDSSLGKERESELRCF